VSEHEHSEPEPDERADETAEAGEQANGEEPAEDEPLVDGR
jgi:hypothetical protein